MIQHVRQRLPLAFVIALLLVCIGCGSTHSVALPTPVPQALYQSTLQAQLKGWPQDEHVFADGNGYHIVDGFVVGAPVSVPSDLLVSVVAKQLSGSTQAAYGITFRLDEHNRYEFDITSQREWYVLKDVETQHSQLVEFTPNAAIHQGLNTANVLTVQTRGARFTFWVNGVQVGSVSDSANSTGHVGLDGDDGAEILYSHFLVTTLG